MPIPGHFYLLYESSKTSLSIHKTAIWEPLRLPVRLKLLYYFKLHIHEINVS